MRRDGEQKRSSSTCGHRISNGMTRSWPSPPPTLSGTSNVSRSSYLSSAIVWQSAARQNPVARRASPTSSGVSSKRHSSSSLKKTLVVHTLPSSLTSDTSTIRLSASPSLFAASWRRMRRHESGSRTSMRECSGPSAQATSARQLSGSIGTTRRSRGNFRSCHGCDCRYCRKCMRIKSLYNQPLTFVSHLIVNLDETTNPMPPQAWGEATRFGARRHFHALLSSRSHAQLHTPALIHSAKTTGKWFNSERKQNGFSPQQRCVLGCCSLIL
jgi:hypothetical protein